MHRSSRDEIVGCPTAPGPVTTKRRNYELWTSGAYGCRLRTWRSVAAWRAGGYGGQVSLRTLRTGDGPCAYDLDPPAVEAEYGRWLGLGVKAEDVVVCEMAPDHRLVVNGEYHHDPLPDGSFRHLFYSRVRKPMRVALREGGRTCSGLRAEILLRESMTWKSWNNFRALADSYSYHVIEFSAYDHCLGDVPGHNVLVWEVRRY